MKQVFIVSPKISPLQKLQLVQKGIQFVEQDARSFIDALLCNLKYNIINDIQHKKVSIDTGIEFLKLHKILPVLEFGQQKLRFKSISGSSPDIKGLINFTIAPKHQNAGLFRDLIDGRHFDPVTVSRDEIESLTASIVGINIPWWNDVEAIKIGPKPASKGILLSFLKMVLN